MPFEWNFTAAKEPRVERVGHGEQSDFEWKYLGLRQLGSGALGTRKPRRPW